MIVALSKGKIKQRLSMKIPCERETLCQNGNSTHLTSWTHPDDSTNNLCAGEVSTSRQGAAPLRRVKGVVKQQVGKRIVRGEKGELSLGKAFTGLHQYRPRESWRVAPTGSMRGNRHLLTGCNHIELLWAESMPTSSWSLDVAWCQ